MTQPLPATPRHLSIRPRALATAAAAVLACGGAQAFDSGSTGADGELAPAANSGVIEVQLPESGVLNYTNVNIPSGVRVRFKKNALNTPVVMLASGNVTIAGVVDVAGGHAAHVGTSGDGNTADDGVPGQGGPGGFDGGRGGSTSANLASNLGGSGLGPGGGKGGINGSDGCTGKRYYKGIGGGAGHATNGWHASRCPSVFALPEAVGAIYGNALLQPLIGGSGGGGATGGGNFGGSGGGGGGGAILIAASGTLTLSGWVLADGGGSGLVAGTNSGWHGGGGSGGAIRLVATTLTGTGLARTVGACINNGDPNGYRSVYYTATAYETIYGPAYYSCADYGGSDGRVRLEAESMKFTGKTYPGYTTGTPAPVFLSKMPALRIASVAGSAVPAVPTGSADVVLPADVANPVTVLFETANVPTGNTVVLKVVPASGNPIEAQSPAIEGSTEAGTASVQVSLPAGPSVLQASTTYTVVVAMGDALSHYAQNERVEKVQLIATLGEATRARLITVSGKSYDVPWSVLQMAGFSG